MVRGDKILINKYKSEYIIKLVGFYICQKWHLTVDNISSKMGNINGEKFRMNYINVNHLVRFYDVLLRFVIEQVCPSVHLADLSNGLYRFLGSATSDLVSLTKTAHPNPSNKATDRPHDVVEGDSLEVRVDAEQCCVCTSLFPKNFSYCQQSVPHVHFQWQYPQLKNHSRNYPWCYHK